MLNYFKFFNIRLPAFCLFFIIPAVFSLGQELSRGSIPEEVLRPAHGEAPRYPVDIIIGELGRGRASAAAYDFASLAASALLNRRVQHSALASVNSAARDGYFSALEKISPQSFRIGGGREEADGSFSFLIRFIGREQGITGEMYIRYTTGHIEEGGETGSWILEELFLEEARSRETENEEAAGRNDFNSYERFF